MRNVKPKENWNETWLKGDSRSDKQEIKVGKKGKHHKMEPRNALE